MAFSWPEYSSKQRLPSGRSWTAYFESYDQHLDLVYYQIELFDDDRFLEEFTAKLSVPVVQGDDWTRLEFESELRLQIAAVAADGKTNTPYEGRRRTPLPLVVDSPPEPPPSTDDRVLSDALLDMVAREVEQTPPPVEPAPTPTPPSSPVPEPAMDVESIMERQHYAEVGGSPEPTERDKVLECLHVTWYRRARLQRAGLVCFVMFDVLFAVSMLLPAFGYLGSFSTTIAAIILLTPLFIWLGLTFLELWLMKDNRGAAGTLSVVANAITLTRGSHHVWTRPVDCFESGWSSGYAGGELQLQRPSGDLLVVLIKDLYAGKRWLAATGLSAPSRRVTCRLSGFEPDWLWGAWIFSFSFTLLGDIVIPRLVKLSNPAGAVLLTILLIVSGILRARATAKATLVVDSTGLRIERFARPARMLQWSELRAIEKVKLEDELRLTFADGSTEILSVSDGVGMHHQEFVLRRMRHFIAANATAPAAPRP